LAGSVVAKIVKIYPKDYGGPSLLGNGSECIHEGGLAPVAAV
jgi:hypothetical protein